MMVMGRGWCGLGWSASRSLGLVMVMGRGRRCATGMKVDDLGCGWGIVTCGSRACSVGSLVSEESSRVTIAVSTR